MKPKSQNHVHGALIITLAMLLSACNWNSTDNRAVEPNPPTPPVAEPLPNILFVIMDDVGIDQLSAMGYGGAQPPVTPAINAIAEQGVRFRNTWSMPECSPGRVALFTGRYPLRSNTYQALGPNDLANSQVSPYELTTAKMLKNANYESAMFGKFHLAGPEFNPAGNGTPSELGWDFFYGWTGGLPASIDTTAGGVGQVGTYSCGFIPSRNEDPVHGADFGACYIPNSENVRCEEVEGSQTYAAGLQCLTQGGVLVPEASCAAEPPASVNFEVENAYYVSPLVINEGGEVSEISLRDPRARGYRTSIEAAAAREWITSRSGEQPWMASLTFTAPHTPIQTPPMELLQSGVGSHLAADCSFAPESLVNFRRTSDAMIEAMDYEFEQLLVDIGVAEHGANGEITYRPESNTVVVVVGDNGSFGPTVKAPFDLTRAKGSAYQTGIWVPLIIAGPMVSEPNRDVEHMVNAVDVFSLFAEIAGVDLAEIAHSEIDSVEMLPYLTQVNAESQRNYNFAQGGLNIQLNGGRNGPCVIGQCTHTPISKSVCEDNGGVWWGVGADNSEVVNFYNSGNLEQCWQVNQAIFNVNPQEYDAQKIEMGATRYEAVRNDNYKLVSNHALDYNPSTDSEIDIYTVEFYRVDQAAALPKLDREDDDLLQGGGLTNLALLTAEERTNFDALNQHLTAILASKPGCLGDGNYDGVVDQRDLDNYHALIASGWSGSSWYDFNYDGVTDETDLEIILANQGKSCAG
ncbi:sulfatase-like hydrolase/transferase [Vibrio navarrensis]|uniref:sulfatase-like hydrolase/transferase n=1 Tax=Vibrio navarrensis TaxID=29495 RepID=UPI001869E2D2|nr:sulfatase-like hydrolase/transferase [Vibrio navarrensis]MBE4582467.1 arylsulfatase [Vibrio navarrensis]